MKAIKVLSILALCLSKAGLLHAQSTSQNYVMTTTMLDSDSIVQIDYFDGLGRMTERVMKGFLPTNRKDQVFLYEYDMAGRQVSSWLPAALTGSGVYADASDVQSSAKSVHSDTKPYTLQNYPNFLDSRPRENYGVGRLWHNNGKAVRTAYLTNSSTHPCRHYSWNDANGTFQRKSDYPKGTLDVIRTSDEDGRELLVFKNLLGQVLLERRVITSETATNGTLDTYYIYDKRGNLRVVLPPASSDAMTQKFVSWTFSNNSTLMDYAYLYTYDNLNRLTSKKLPGADPIYYRYDKRHQLIFSQDGNQRESNQWQVQLYDSIGRPTICGIVSMTTPPDVSSTHIYTTYTGLGGINGYALSGINLSNMRILETNYYDNYDFAANQLSTAEAGMIDVNTPSQDFAMGNLTGNRVYIDDDTNPALSQQSRVSVYFYDDNNHVVREQHTNFMNGCDTYDNTYSLTGKLLEQTHTHSALVPSNTTNQTDSIVSLTEILTFAYDYGDRLLTTYHQTGNNDPVLIADNRYNVNTGYLQQLRNPVWTTIFYYYNVRGQLTQATNGKFSELLVYNQSLNNLFALSPQYAGNISAIRCDYKNGVMREQQYTYNNLNQLTGMNYNTSGEMYDDYGVALTYDRMGNVLTLNRKGELDGLEYGMVDSLTFVYNGNHIDELIEHAIDEPNYAGAQHVISEDHGSYDYDANGNMTAEPHKHITNISYNSLNLPRQITISEGGNTQTLSYDYTASGERVRAKGIFQHYANPGQPAPPADTLQNETYCDNLIYSSNCLVRSQYDWGYIAFNEQGEPNYHFYIKDHAGNVRVVVNQAKQTKQKNDYYPFGALVGAMTGVNYQQYRYGTKELVRLFGLDMYDSQARWYDASTARFTTMDPLLEKYYHVSPYAYCMNNPVNAVDPDGRDWYKNNQTSYYTWYDGDEAREGFTHIGGAGSLLGEFESKINTILTDVYKNDKGLYSEGRTIDITNPNKGAIIPSKISKMDDFLDEFVFGYGPEISILTGNHPYTKDLQTDDCVLESQQKLRRGNTTIPGQITKVNRSWGLLDALFTTSLAKQFVGSYTFDSYTSKDKKHLLNIIYDTKNLRSFFYHFPGTEYLNHSRENAVKPLANTYQFYIWESEK